MKTIWIVNYYAKPPQYTTNPRHIEFAKRLQDKGYNVIVICSGYLRDKDIQFVPSGKSYHTAIYEGLKFVHIKACKYSGNGIKRMLSIFQFAVNVLRLRNKFEKADILYQNIHMPFDYPVCWCAKRMCAKYIVESWDLWPNSFEQFGLVSAYNPLLEIAYRIERRVYEKADKIVFSMQGGIDYLHEKRWTTEEGGGIAPSKVFYVNNGVNLEKFYRDCDTYPTDDSDLNAPDTFKVIYLGSIRLVNDVKKLIDAANLLKNNSRYRFLIYGDGSDRPFLERYCRDNHIDNVIFKDKMIPLSHVAYVVSQSSLNIMNYSKNFGRYGVSSGKLFQYLAAGKPICCNVDFRYNIINDNAIGISKTFNSPADYAAAIDSIGQMNQEEYAITCERVRNCALQYDYSHLFKKFLTIIENV